jgi:hypothetical protein
VWCTQLADVRDTKGKGTNLLAHLLRQVEDKEPGLLDALHRELAPVLSASLRERLNVAADEAHMLSNGLRQIEEFICEIAPKSDTAAAGDSLTTANGDGKMKKKKLKKKKTATSKLMGSMKSPVALTKQMRNKKAAAAANKINKAEAQGEQEDRFYAAAKVPALSLWSSLLLLLLGNTTHHCVRVRCVSCRRVVCGVCRAARRSWRRRGRW